MSKKPRPASPLHVVAPDPVTERVASPRVGAMVLWSPPDEVRRLDVREILGPEVPAVVARAWPDGTADLHPLPPLGSPALRVEATHRVRRDDSAAPGTWRPAPPPSDD